MKILPKPFFSSWLRNGYSLREIDELNAIEKANSLTLHYPQ
ncbi:hypothetical protein L901_18905 [Agrobacterium sp. D14]|nr:hypothetical protein L901_18905 [Agrobacterium sp. D14]